MKGEKIYQYDLDITGVTDFGQSLEPFLAGAVPITSGYALTAPSILHPANHRDRSQPPHRSKRRWSESSASR